jgi:hypothetical protein
VFTKKTLPLRAQSFFTKNTKRISICIVSGLFFTSSNLIAQTKDSTQEGAESSSVNSFSFQDLDNQTIGRQRHIYDTSEIFFNWKEDNGEAYSDEKFQTHAASDSSIKNFRNADDFWYVKAVEKFKQDVVRLRTDKAFRDSLAKAGYLQPDEQVFKNEQQTTVTAYPAWLQFVVWTIVIGVFVYALVYFLLTNKISLFAKRDTAATSSSTSEAENIFQLPYHNLLQKACQDKNYRQAVRILYLQTLKMMSEKNIIKFQPDYTNLNYLSQLNHTNYFKDFFNITHHYEYVWYGKFEVPEERFDKIKSDFESIQQKITTA